ncbi:MAG: T9SS type A sorting domain-containing protein [bacterium]
MLTIKTTVSKSLIQRNYHSIQNKYKLFIMSIFICTFFLFIFSSSALKSQQIQSDSLNNFGTLWGWGINNMGQLGDSTKIDRLSPVQIGKDYHWKNVTTNRFTTFAIKDDGSLWGWGLNSYERLGDGSSDSYISPHRIGSKSYWDCVSAGQCHTIATQKDGSLWAWGSNGEGQLGNSDLSLDKIYPTPNRITKNFNYNISYICAGSFSSAAISDKGTLFTWGLNTDGQLGDGTNNDKNYPVQIGKASEWRDVVSYNHRMLAIKKDGTLWEWGKGVYSPKQIGTDADWASLALALEHYFVIKQNGTLWVCGKSTFGELGDSTLVDASSLVQIGKDTDWKSVQTDWYNTFAIKNDGTLWTWGSQYWSGGGGVGGIRFKVPTKVENIADVYQLSYFDACMFIKRHIPSLPEVVTLPITNVSDSTAESGGNVTNDGKEWDLVRGICWAETPNPTINDSITIDGQGVGEYPSFLRNLKPFTKYYVRAYATNSVGTAYGQNETFGSKIPSPILIYPKNGNYNIPLDASLIWKTVSLAKSYRVQIYNSSKLISDEVITDTTFKYNKYDLMSQYDWRVQAISGSDSSDWTDNWSFMTSKFYPAQLLKPGKDTINIPIDCELIWKENISGSKYNLQFSKNNDFTKPDIDTTLSATNLQIKDLEFLHLYFWRVRAKEGTDISEWSPIWKFTILMDSVNLKTPADLTKNINILSALSWEEGIYKKDYRLQISESNDFATTIADTLISKTANTDVKNLNYWQKYFWRVRNESGDTLGYWSQIWQFKTRMSDILLMYPENTQTGLGEEINFKWYPVIGAEYYQLQISKNDIFTNMVYSKDSITITEKLVPDLEKDILYYWRVRVWNQESIGTAYWSEVWTFRTGETGVKEESDVIQIIPNPAGDYITVALKPSEGFEPLEGSEINIYNTLGEKVMTVSARHAVPLRINISDFPKGIYFIKVGGETKKFVKM